MAHRLLTLGADLQENELQKSKMYLAAKETQEMLVKNAMMIPSLSSINLPADTSAISESENYDIGLVNHGRKDLNQLDQSEATISLFESKDATHIFESKYQNKIPANSGTEIITQQINDLLFMDEDESLIVGSQDQNIREN